MAGIPVETPTGNAAAFIAMRSALGLIKGIKDFGAVCDGVADDQVPLQSASTWLNAAAGRTLMIQGTPRVGRRTTAVFTNNIAKEGAITVIAPNNATLAWEPGASIIMDNLNGSGVGDNMHGVAVRGPGAGLTIIGLDVRWKTKPSSRSQGDGLRCHGYPHETNLGSGGDGLISNVTVLGSYVKWAPQAGIVFNGCSDVLVSRHHAYETLADGCHFNACRRVEAGNISGKDTGDDTCAFVTYYHASSVETGTVGIDPYAQSALTEWCGTESHVASVNCEGSLASGLRFAGAWDVHVDSVVATGAVQAASADGGKANGTTFMWTFLQPRRCTIGQVAATLCGIGYQSRSFNTSIASDSSTYWDQDVSVGRIVARGCTNKSVWFDHVSGTNVADIDAEDAPVVADEVLNLVIGRMRIANSVVSPIQCYTNGVAFGSARPINNIKIGEISLINALLNLQDPNGCTVGLWKTHNAPKDAVIWERATDLKIPQIDISYPNRLNDGSENRGILALGSIRVDVGRMDLVTDTNGLLLWNLNTGGAVVPQDVTFRDVNVVTTKNASTISTYADAGALRFYRKMRFRNLGEASPIWRYSDANDPRV